MEHEQEIITRQALVAYNEHLETQAALEYYRKQKERGKIKEVDTGRPKKPKTPYLYYCDERRPILLKKNIAPAEVSRMCGEEWAKLTPEERKPYDDLYAQAIQDHALQVQAYTEEMKKQHEKQEREALKFFRAQQKEKEAQGVLKEMERQEKIEKIERKTTRAAAALTLTLAAAAAPPKAPTKAFAFYCNDHQDSIQEEFPDSMALEIAAILSDRWDHLPAEERRPYEELEAMDLDRYNAEMETGAEVVVEVQQQPSGARKNAKKPKDPNGPKRPVTAFIFFCREQRPKIREKTVGIKTSEVTSMLAEIWRGLSEKQKKVSPLLAWLMVLFPLFCFLFCFHLFLLLGVFFFLALLREVWGRSREVQDREGPVRGHPWADVGGGGGGGVACSASLFSSLFLFFCSFFCLFRFFLLLVLSFHLCCDSW